MTLYIFQLFFLIYDEVSMIIEIYEASMIIEIYDEASMIIKINELTNKCVMHELVYQSIGVWMK